MGKKFEALVEKVKSQAGSEWQVAVYEITRGMIKRFTEAIGDPNPLWHDEEYARKNGYPSIIAPPTFNAAIYTDEITQQMPYIGKEGLNAGNNVEFFKPIRPGDMITVTAKMGEIGVRTGKRGRMALIGVKCTFTNQNKEVVATDILDSIFFEDVMG